MKFRNVIAASAFVLAVLGVSGANAATFEFSYAFNNDSGVLTGDVIKGYFTGNLINANDVTGISNVTASFDNISLGSLYANSYVGPANQGDKINYQAGGAIASLDGFGNNFVFTTKPYSSPNWPGSYFYIIQPWVNPGPGNTIAVQYVGPPGVVVENYNGDYAAGNWTLTAVPEPATWAMLLLGFFGIGFMVRDGRRRENVSVA